MPYVPFRFYAPDLDPSTRGLVKDGEGLFPTQNGFKAAPAPRDSILDELTATALAAATVELLDGTLRTFAGTSTELFEKATTTWTDRSRDGNDYTACTSWVFAQIGDQTLATNDVTPIQQSTSDAFADLTGAPVALAVAVVENQVFAFNTNESTFGDSSDRWWTSALGDTGDWTPSISTGSVSARIVENPGEIVGGRRLNDDMIIYKRDSMYRASSVGPPEWWVVDTISDEVGSVSHKAVVPLDNAHLFMGKYDFWAFDNSGLRSLGEGLRENFFKNELNRDFLSKTIGIWDRRDNRIDWYYVSNDSTGALDRRISYDLRSSRFAPPTDISVEAAFFFTNSTSPTYDTLGDLYSTYEDLPNIPYDDPFWQTTIDRSAIINTSHKLQTLDKSASATSIKIFDFGAGLVRQDAAQYSYFKRLRPRFSDVPNSGTMVNSYRDDLGGGFTSDSPTSTLNDGKFDVEREARWHTVRMEFDGDHEILGVDIDLQPEGDE